MTRKVRILRRGLVSVAVPVEASEPLTEDVVEEVLRGLRERMPQRSLERPTREDLLKRLRTRQPVEPREPVAAAVAAEREGR